MHGGRLLMALAAPVLATGVVKSWQRIWEQRGGGGSGLLAGGYTGDLHFIHQRMRPLAEELGGSWVAACDAAMPFDRLGREQEWDGYAGVYRKAHRRNYASADMYSRSSLDSLQSAGSSAAASSREPGRQDDVQSTEHATRHRRRRRRWTRPVHPPQTVEQTCILIRNMGSHDRALEVMAAHQHPAFASITGALLRLVPAEAFSEETVRRAIVRAAEAGLIEHLRYFHRLRDPMHGGGISKRMAAYDADVLEAALVRSRQAVVDYMLRERIPAASAPESTRDFNSVIIQLRRAVDEVYWKSVSDDTVAENELPRTLRRPMLDMTVRAIRQRFDRAFDMLWFVGHLPSTDRQYHHALAFNADDDAVVLMQAVHYDASSAARAIVATFRRRMEGSGDAKEGDIQTLELALHRAVTLGRTRIVRLLLLARTTGTETADVSSTSTFSSLFNMANARGYIAIASMLKQARNGRDVSKKRHVRYYPWVKVLEDIEEDAWVEASPSSATMQAKYALPRVDNVSLADTDGQDDDNDSDADTASSPATLSASSSTSTLSTFASPRRRSSFESFASTSSPLPLRPPSAIGTPAAQVLVQ